MIKINMFFLNFLTKDVNLTREFYEYLGLETVMEYTSDVVYSAKINEQTFIMFVNKDMLEKLVDTRIKNPVFNQNIISMMLKTKEEVVSIENKLLAKNIDYKTLDDANMYYLRFLDPNGYFVEIGYFKTT